MSTSHNISDEDDTRSAAWFQRHPVISTMLWLLGNPEREDDDGQELNTDKLTWKDADGANLAEFISEIQVKEPVKSPSSSSRASTVSASSSSSGSGSVGGAPGTSSRRHKGGLGSVAHGSLASLNSTESEEPRARRNESRSNSVDQDSRYRASSVGTGGTRVHQSGSSEGDRSGGAASYADDSEGGAAGVENGVGLPTPPNKSPDGWGFHVSITPSSQSYE
jgi:hypothetical protein